MKRSLFVLTFIVAVLAGRSAESEARQAARTSQAPEWQTIADWFGSGIKQTESFSTGSREWRIYWRTKNASSPRAGVLQIFVHRTDTDAVVATAANVQGAGSDVSYVRAPIGRFYLSINSANVNWLVRVEDKRPIVGPPRPMSPHAQKIEEILNSTAKQERKSEAQFRREQAILFLDELIKSKTLVSIADDKRGFHVDGNTWRSVAQEHREVLMLRLADYRQAETGLSDIAVYDGETGLELASYSPRQGVRFR
jgi:carboxylesterase type B